VRRGASGEGCPTDFRCQGLSTSARCTYVSRSVQLRGSADMAGARDGSADHGEFPTVDAYSVRNRHSSDSPNRLASKGFLCLGKVTVCVIEPNLGGLTFCTLSWLG